MYKTEEDSMYNSHHVAEKKQEKLGLEIFGTRKNLGLEILHLIVHRLIQQYLKQSYEAG